MDGFTFLRWLMRTFPRPTLVVSSRESNKSVFRALELGAADFVLKPVSYASEQLGQIEGEVIAKLREIAAARPEKLAQRAQRLAASAAGAGGTLGRKKAVVRGRGGPLPLRGDRGLHRRPAGAAAGALRACRGTAGGGRHRPAHAGGFHEDVRRAPRPHRRPARQGGRRRRGAGPGPGPAGPRREKPDGAGGYGRPGLRPARGAVADRPLRPVGGQAPDARRRRRTAAGWSPWSSPGWATTARSARAPSGPRAG